MADYCASGRAAPAWLDAASRTRSRAPRTRRYAMYPPDVFAVDYAINPWMDVTTPVDVPVARDQWNRLYHIYLQPGHTVELVEPMPGLPDMVLAAYGFRTDARAHAEIGFHVVHPAAATGFASQLRAAGFEPVGVDMSELLKGGGSVKCCTLEVHQ